LLAPPADAFFEQALTLAPLTDPEVEELLALRDPKAELAPDVRARPNAMRTCLPSRTKPDKARAARRYSSTKLANGCCARKYPPNSGTVKSMSPRRGL
jgi:hypothetical protein